MPQDANLPAVTQTNGVEAYRASTDAATLCRAVVLATAVTIQGRKYIKAEGWQAIAIAHGCTGSACNVEKIEGGFRATGQVRRMDTGAVIAEGEGFVGEDEATWFGDGHGKKKRPDYAIRAMAQTRAISRACRAAFAHVAIQIDKNLGTTPAEEMDAIEHEPVSDANMANTSWGPGGKEAAIDEARASGLMDNAPKYRADQIRNMHKWLNTATGTLKLSGQTSHSIGEFWMSCTKKREQIEDALPTEYKALEKVYQEAVSAAQARGA
jgi:hypothetical protein